MINRQPPLRPRDLIMFSNEVGLPILGLSRDFRLKDTRHSGIGLIFSRASVLASPNPGQILSW
jgi:hypothetical protein